MLNEKENYPLTPEFHQKVMEFIDGSREVKLAKQVSEYELALKELEEDVKKMELELQKTSSQNEELQSALNDAYKTIQKLLDKMEK